MHEIHCKSVHRSPDPIALNVWHRVAVSRINRMGTISINQTEVARGYSEVVTLTFDL